MPFSSSVRAIGSSIPLTSASSASAGLQDLEPLVVEGRRDVARELAELVAVGVGR